MTMNFPMILKSNGNPLNIRKFGIRKFGILQIGIQKFIIKFSKMHAMEERKTFQLRKISVFTINVNEILKKYI